MLPATVNPESADAPTGDGEQFSMLALRDRVVIMLLFDQIVQEEQVAMAWNLWHDMMEEGVKEPLWRILTIFPDVDAEMVYAEAARVYGFEEARVSRSRAIGLIQDVERRVDEGVWNQMVELRLVPINRVEQPHSHRQRTVYATHDPARHEVQRLLRTVENDGYELRYVPEAMLLELLVQAFPRSQRYQQLQAGQPSLPADVGDYLEVSVPAEEVHVFSEGASSEEEAATTDTSTRQAASTAGGSLIGRFEDVLEQAIQRHATDICLLPNAEGQVEVYFQVHKQLKRWKVFQDVSASALLSVVKREILGLRSAESKQTHKRVIRRWIQGTPVRFRVTALPPSDDLHSESIVIRILQ
jgi:type II secretory ATPase GspE/PulE/Tfp pilus assembly ATPase PilB-like protein